jgi:hypothetical protein
MRCARAPACPRRGRCEQHAPAKGMQLHPSASACHFLPNGCDRLTTEANIANPTPTLSLTTTFIIIITIIIMSALTTLPCAQSVPTGDDDCAARSVTEL